MELNKKSTKAFNPTICFTFFGSWVKTIERLETDADVNSPAYMLFKAIANYSMFGVDPDFDDNPYLAAIWEMLEQEIDTSVNRRKSGFADDDVNERYQTVKSYLEEYPNATRRQIAEDTGISKSAVDRIIRRIEFDATENGTDSISDSASDSDIVIDSMGRDSGTPQSLSTGNKNHIDTKIIESYYDEPDMAYGMTDEQLFEANHLHEHDYTEYDEPNLNEMYEGQEQQREDESKRLEQEHKTQSKKKMHISSAIDKWFGDECTEYIDTKDNVNSPFGGFYEKLRRDD